MATTFNLEKLQEVLEQYKAHFEEQWTDEKYKWRAVKHFQEHWDMDAADFAGMLARSLEKTGNLLASYSNYPREMILRFAKAAPEEVRAMFRALFDESADVVERIAAFKQQAASLLEQFGDGAAHHYQYENPITTYLWLRYPDKYYIYKYGEVQNVAEFLESLYRFRKGIYAENIRNCFSLYGQINKVLQEDAALVELVRSHATGVYYPDAELKTLTIDVGFYISRHCLEKDEETEEVDTPAENENRAPALWKISHGAGSRGIPDAVKPILEHRHVVAVHGATKAKGISKKSQGQAFVEEIRQGDYFFLCYGNRIQLLGKITTEQAAPNPEMGDGWLEHGYQVVATPLLEVPYTGQAKWWTPNDNSTCVQVGEEDFSLCEELILKPYFGVTVEQLLEGETPSTIRYWWLVANPRIWSFSSLAVGKEQSYTLYNDNHHKRRIFQNFLAVKPGDLVIGYESAPAKKIVALGQITQGSDGKRIQFQKTEGLVEPVSYSSLKECPELAQMEFFQQSNGSLFKLTQEEYEFLLDVIRESNPLPEAQEKREAYDETRFLLEVYLDEMEFQRLNSLLRYKKNVILQGPPGVGKTFAAQRLAWAMLGRQDDSHIQMVQFHQNTSYEDFVMGYRPTDSGFELREGVFLKFCQEAQNHPKEPYFFLIDEINRGNLSKIFGELLMLIEKDYRNYPITLSYDGRRFSVPENLYLIGMMNTADRSLALMDYALRRRFAFFPMKPGFESEGFKTYQESLGNETLHTLIGKIKALNQTIVDDPDLGEGFQIGHSYLCGWQPGECTDEALQAVVEFEILPTLREYWFDDLEKVKEWEQKLRGVFHG